MLQVFIVWLEGVASDVKPDIVPVTSEGTPSNPDNVPVTSAATPSNQTMFL
jgi:hypothetical protein